MSKLTEEEIKQKVFNNTLQTCEYVSNYENSNSTITVKCIKHNIVFQTKWENVRRDNRAHHICPLCQEEDKNKKYENSRTEIECAYCHKKFIKPNSKLENSKSGLYFCCREHKDLAQQIGSGGEFDKIRPDHYGKYLDDSQNYRLKALRTYSNKCAICNYDEEPKILQVHHIDENRSNNKLDNLIILCPNCHAKITWGGYKLIDKKMIIKQGEV